MVLILYVANHMGVGSVGIYTTLMTWASIISLISLFGGYNIIQKEGTSDKIVSIVLFLSCSFSIACSFFIVELLFTESRVAAFVIVISESLGLAIKSVTKSICYSKDQVSTLAKFNFYNSSVYIISLCFLFYIDEVGFFELTIFVLVCNVFSILLYGFCITKNVRVVNFKAIDFVNYITRSYSYLISSSLRNLFMQIDKVIINLAFGNTISGVYNLCSRFVTTAILPSNIYIQTIESKFYHSNGKSFELLKKARVNVMKIAFSLSLLSVPFVLTISNYLTGLDGVSEAYLYFIPLAVSMNLAYAYLSYLNAENNRLRIVYLVSLIAILCFSVFIVWLFFPSDFVFVPLVSSFFIFLSLVFINAKIRK
ncbi:hypothetical protein VSWAT3_10621 [Vibrionales bacterium SWAT-3]|nr:hypothetical protein VSWAT3_10621 [Vibrionales bacterium SWAT-3]